MNGNYPDNPAEEALRVIEARRQFLPVLHDPGFFGAPQVNSAIAGQATTALYEGRPVLIVPPDIADIARGLIEGRYTELPERTAIIYSGAHSPFSNAADERRALEHMFDSGKPNKVISELGGFYLDGIVSLDQNGKENHG